MSILHRLLARGAVLHQDCEQAAAREVMTAEVLGGAWLEEEEEGGGKWREIKIESFVMEMNFNSTNAGCYARSTK